MPTMDLPTETTVPAGLEDVAAALAAGLPRTREQLEALVRIPSISSAPDHADDCRRSAEATAELLRGVGLDDVELLELPPGDDGAPVHPYVAGSWRHAGPDAPTVLLYAHHDVQPIGTPEGWGSPPFEPTERDGRLYGRGAADDKAGVLAHVAALGAWRDARGSLPVNVEVLIEGEEEIGSPNLDRFVAAHGARLADADVIVLTDLVNWRTGWPGLTYALRGMADVTVTVATLEQPVHSGMWGGPVPDALTATARLLATLHDDRGEIAVAGFADDVRPLSDDERARLAELGYTGDELRSEARMLDGVRTVGDPDRDLLERLWMRPTITPTGIDAPAVADAANTLLAAVRTKLSVRLAPGQDPDRAIAALTDHLEAHAPFGAHVEVAVGERNRAWVTEPGGSAWEAAVAAMTAAYGRAPAALGCGGSIPFVEPIAAAAGDAPCLLVGVEDPSSNAHGDDESLHLDDFTKACLTEAFLLAELADRADELVRRRA